MEGRKCGLHAYCGFSGVNACGKVVKDYIYNVLSYLSGVVGIIRKSLIVGDENVNFIIIA